MPTSTAPAAFALRSTGSRCTLLVCTFLPHSRIVRLCKRSNRSLLSEMPKSVSCAVSLGPEQMSPRLIVTGPKRSNRWSTRCLSRPSEPREQALRREVERLVPADRLERRVQAVAPHHRRGEARRVRLPREEAAGALAQETARDRVLGVTAQQRGSPVLDGHEQRAGVGAVAVAGRAARAGHAGASGDGIDRVRGGARPTG
jgi:hypothetical protein